TSARLIPQRTYQSVRHGAVSAHSITYSQIPDIAIEVSKGSTLTTVIVFDPKYKLDGTVRDDEGTSRPLKADIDKMHAYRDAIRNANGTRVVRYAAILYPGETEAFSNEIGALCCRPGSAPGLSQQLYEIVRHQLVDAVR